MKAGAFIGSGRRRELANQGDFLQGGGNVVRDEMSVQDSSCCGIQKEQGRRPLAGVGAACRRTQKRRSVGGLPKKVVEKVSRCTEAHRDAEVPALSEEGGPLVITVR